MAAINDIIINITNGARALTQKSFRPLILSANKTGSTASRFICSTLTDVVSAGFPTTDDVYKMAAAMLAQSPSPNDFMVAVSPDPVDVALGEIYIIDPNFYGILITSRAKADLHLAGTWANSNECFFIGGTSDLTALDLRNVDREAYLLHTSPGDFPDAAWMGRVIPTQPGSATWKWKVLNGQIASTFTSTQLQTIRTENGQALQEVKGQIYVNEGKATSGEFIDVIIGKDWIKDQIYIGVLSLFLNNDKISLDDSGIARIEAVIRDVLKRSGDNQIVARAVSADDLSRSDDKVYISSVTVPQRSDLSSNDRALRQLNGVKFSYDLAGAIHQVTINGIITA